MSGGPLYRLTTMGWDPLDGLDDICYFIERLRAIDTLVLVEHGNVNTAILSSSFELSRSCSWCAPGSSQRRTHHAAIHETHQILQWRRWS